jgi:hypothetical protein
MGKTQYTNIDNIAPHPGDIAVLSNENASAVVGLANSNSLVILGTWIDSPNPGFVGTVENDNVYVNCEVLPSLGDRLYLSAANKGQVTNTAPPNAYFVGSVLQIGQQIGAYYQIQTIFNKYGSPLATAVSPGTVPNYPILPADAPALSTKTHAPRTQSANADTPTLTDEDGVVWMTYAGASTVTLPQDSDLAFTVGRAVAYKCANAAGKITFAAGAGATLVVSRVGCASLIPQNPWGTAYKSAANTWELIGPFVG